MWLKSRSSYLRDGKPSKQRMVILPLEKLNSFPIFNLTLVRHRNTQQQTLYKVLVCNMFEHVCLLNQVNILSSREPPSLTT